MFLLHSPGLLLCLSDCSLFLLLFHCCFVQSLSFCSVPSACCCLTCLPSCSVYHNCSAAYLLFSLFFHCCFVQSLSFCSVPSACCCLTCLPSCCVYHSCSAAYLFFSVYFSFLFCAVFVFLLSPICLLLSLLSSCHSLLLQLISHSLLSPSVAVNSCLRSIAASSQLDLRLRRRRAIFLL